MASSPTPRNSTSNQVVKIYLSLTEKKDNIVRTMKQNHTKHIHFSFFNPLKVTGELKISRKFRISSWERSRWRRTRHGAKPVSFLPGPLVAFNREHIMKHMAFTSYYKSGSSYGPTHGVRAIN